MEKINKETALARLKALMDDFYSKIGREIVEDTDVARQHLIEDIDDILNKTEISTRHLIIEKLELENLI